MKKKIGMSKSVKKYAMGGPATTTNTTNRPIGKDSEAEKMKRLSESYKNKQQLDNLNKSNSTFIQNTQTGSTGYKATVKPVAKEYKKGGVVKKKK